MQNQHCSRTFCISVLMSSALKVASKLLPEVQIGLIVNDVAKINIDSKLVRERTAGGIDTGDCVELQNGCACCNARSAAHFDMLYGRVFFSHSRVLGCCQMG